nr:hypothetical protein [Tanacetum cinerariifolium]
MSSYEVIVNGYYGMPMDPLDPYLQLYMEAPPLPDYIPRPEAPPSPDYIPGPEAPPSPDYIPGPEVPPSPDYIPGSEYPEYLPPADVVLSVEEQPLSATDSIEYPTCGGDDDADDDGDDLSEDDTDDEDEKESSDSEEEEEEHLAPTVAAPALYSFVFASKETEPFKEGETVATPPPFGYRVAARISVQPHILMPFRLESEVERLLAIPTPQLSPVSPTSYPLPPFLMPLPIFTPLPTSSFSLPLSLPGGVTDWYQEPSYEVIVNGYYGMPMDPLDPYVQLIMEAPPLTDYIPGPEAPPLPDYIPGPEAPHLPDYIPGPEYPEYLPLADDVLPAEEQRLPAAVSPTAESPGYITESEPKMEPEEEDKDDEKSEEDSIEYPTRGGDDDADDDGEDLSKDDADGKDEEESSDKPFEEGEIAATPPPFGYCVAARISVQPHIFMSFRSESEVERLLAIPTPPLSPLSPTLYPLPPFLMPLPIFTPLPTSSFP